jgi:hypothetical protein
MADGMDIVRKLTKIVFGVILILFAAGMYLWWGWWHELLVLIKGGLPLVVAFIGLIFILLGWAD